VYLSLKKSMYFASNKRLIFGYIFYLLRIKKYVFGSYTTLFVLRLNLFQSLFFGSTFGKG